MTQLALDISVTGGVLFHLQELNLPWQVSSLQYLVVCQLSFSHLWERMISHAYDPDRTPVVMVWSTQTIGNLKRRLGLPNTPVQP